MWQHVLEASGLCRLLIDNCFLQEMCYLFENSTIICIFAVE